MAKIISQETFDDVVKENVVDFSMSAEEAKEETIKQFEAQGINLANIIKDLAIDETTGLPMLSKSIDTLKMHISGEKKLEVKELIENLNIFESECKKSIPHRVLAGKLSGHQTLITMLENELQNQNYNVELIIKCLNAEIALTHKQPDIFDAEALAIIIKILKNHQNNYNLISATLQYLAKTCVMHETNRQQIMSADMIQYLKPLVGIKNEKIIRDVCAVFRYLILDDDIRVEFGKAHEHAKIIATEVIIDLTKLLPEYNDVNVHSDLLVTVASLAVRHDFCVTIEDAGGLKFVLDLMIKYPESLKLNREALKLLRALAGHDQVKVHIVQQGAAPIIYNILINHKGDESLAGTALACISTLTLRVKDNSAAFFETGISEIIVETMKLHPTSKIVQRNAAWAIRNMVSRSRDQCESFLSAGAEELLNLAMQDHPSILQDVKAALRDLNCKVDLKEEWTGKAEIKITN